MPKFVLSVLQRVTNFGIGTLGPLRNNELCHDASFLIGPRQIAAALAEVFAEGDIVALERRLAGA